MRSFLCCMLLASALAGRPPVHMETDGIGYTFGSDVYANDPDFHNGFIGDYVTASDGTVLPPGETQYLEFDETAFHFDSEPERPTLYFQHNSIIVADLAFDVCEYHGARPTFVRGTRPPLKNAFGEDFHPVIFAPAWFYATTSKWRNASDPSAGVYGFPQKFNEICIAWVTECPLRAGTNRETKYCQESTCLADYSLAGYILVEDDPNFAINMPSSGNTATFTASWADQGQPAQTRYHSHFNDPKPGGGPSGADQPGCVTGANGEPGPCWIPFVNLVSYHTHNTNGADDSHAIFMQVTNPTKSTTVKTGPAAVWFDQQYFEAHYGHPMKLDSVQNCFKVTSENGAEGVYVDNVAPYGLYGEDTGGSFLNQSYTPAHADYDYMLDQLNRFTPEEFDVIFAYKKDDGQAWNGVGTERPTPGDSKHPVQLEMTAMCMLQPDWHYRCYEALLVIDNPYVPRPLKDFWKVTAIVCLCYPFLYLTQKMAFGKYHDRFKDKGPSLKYALKLHVIVGMYIIFSGVGIVLHNWSDSYSYGYLHDNVEWMQPFFITVGVAGILHACSTFRMLQEVQGERRLTIPIYFVAAVLNLFNACKLCAQAGLYEFKTAYLCERDLGHIDINLFRFLLLWSSVCTFVYVRAHLVIMVLFSIHYFTAYTYSIIGAAAITYPLSGQTPWVYIGLMLFVLYAPFHDKMQEWLGWDESNARIQGAATNGVMTDGMMTELLTFVAELKQTTGPDDVPPAGSGGEQGSAGIERVASAKKEVEEQMMVKWMESLRDRPELASALRAVLQDVPSSRERGYSRIDRVRGRHSARMGKPIEPEDSRSPGHRDHHRHVNFWQGLQQNLQDHVGYDEDEAKDMLQERSYSRDQSRSTLEEKSRDKTPLLHAGSIARRIRGLSHVRGGRAQSPPGQQQMGAPKLTEIKSSGLQHPDPEVASMANA